MTKDYIDAYNEAYEEKDLEGYEEGLNNPATEEEYPEGKQLYHFLSLFKNVSDIMKMHFPQENLKLIHELDSYYAPYDLTEGKNQVVITDDSTEDNLTFKTSGHLEKLVSVKVDGKELNESDRDLYSGSTILTLKNSFLRTLSSGTHTLKMTYIDNTIETTFNIENNSSNIVEENNIIENPKTGDNILYHLLMLVISFIGFTTIIKYYTKESNNIYN